jgi:outer membrane protein assembly factor BamB
MNPKFLLTAILLLTSTVCFCQKKEIQIVNNKITIGKNFITNNEIKTAELIFPEKIFKVYSDTATNLLTVQLRGLKQNGNRKNNGTIVQYDMENNKVLWSKKIDYKASYISQYSKNIFLTRYDISYKLDIYSGDILWEIPSSIDFIDLEKEIAIALRSDGLGNNRLEGIDLKTGKKLWKRPISSNFGWSDHFFVNDSTLIVLADGLLQINIHTGKGWKYMTSVSSNENFGTGGYFVLRNIISNPVIDSASIFLASKTQIAKIDSAEGTVIWKKIFPENLASKSNLFLNDSTIYMVNRGYALFGYASVLFGKPFIAAFDKKTGEQRYFTSISSKEMSILSFLRSEDEIYMVFKNKMAKYDVKSGELVLEKTFQTESLGDLKYFSNNRVFIENESENIQNVWAIDTTNLYVFTTKNKLLSVSK